ncbi:MAG: hypothetical protein K6E98_13370 [Lachnospiraceae bacterium]|nr:hypothetical protein [Lachnospiraceae bacterium]
MGIIRQKEVKEYSKVMILTVFLSVIFVIAAIVIVKKMPQIQERLEQHRLNKDIRSIEKVYSALQDTVNDKTIINSPSSFWNASLSDLEDMGMCANFCEGLRKRLKVSSLKKYEENCFKSEAFKGSKYCIYMYMDTDEIHLTVKSNLPEVQGDVEY